MEERVYKVVNGRGLRVHLFWPAGYPNPAVAIPAAVSIHGGGWTQGPIEWGHADAQFFASLGFLGVAVEYRLAVPPGTTVLDAIHDVNSALRWVRSEAASLGVDPDRIVAVGHSAGAHLALCTALFPGLHGPEEPVSVASEPNAVVALAPAVSPQTYPGFEELLGDQIPVSACSPKDHVRTLGLPVLVIHGTDDEVLAVDEVRDYTARMGAAGNRLEFHGYPGGKHNFFYDDPEGIRFWQSTVQRFLVASGITG